MIFKTEDSVTLENLHGGNGRIKLEKCEVDQHQKLELLVKVTVPINGSIGYHQHIDDYEGYYILNGEGVFQDKHGKSKVESGDFCLINTGDSHGIENTGATEMTIFAIVMK